ncbi:MAG TPA: efflux RND transporter periplasmic adaptor subunit [Hydrogenophaga sp.]|nr:efflux RND transporter periplasmic adaptor subunit [Hydrogenophaga sp.]
MKTRHFVLIVTSLLAMAACSDSPPPQEPIRSVKLLTVQADKLGSHAEYAGEVRARLESRLGFRVGGKLIERPAEVGQRVEAGQLLARLDARDLALGSQAAQAQVAAARTQRDLAAADLKRFADLQKQGFVSGAEIERREATLKAAEATLQQAQAQGAVQGNQAAYARLQADKAGVVMAVEAEVGQVVGAGTPVVRLAQDGPRDVVVAVPEDRVASIGKGLEASVRFWADANNGSSPEGVTATVREVAASADPATRTFQVKLALPADLSVPLGATAYVQFATKDPAAAPVVKVPTTALLKEGEGTAVWVFDKASSTVSTRTVQVLTADGNEVAIAAGLQPGDEVVSAGVHVLSPGQKVTRFAAAATH